MASVNCLPGYDCVASSSCPAPSVQCPKGYFCGNWGQFVDSSNSLLEEDRLGRLVARATFGDFEEVDELVDNWRANLPASRFFSGECLKGYICENTSSLTPCPAGKWCPEQALSALPCDAPSTCGSAGVSYQVTFAMPILAGLLTLVLLTAACFLRQTQKWKEAESRKRQVAVAKPGATPAEQGNGALPSVIAQLGPSTGLTFEVHNVHLSVHGRSLLRHIAIPPIRPGELSVLLGPSGAGKTLLLNVLRGTAARMPGAALTGTLEVGGTRLDLSDHRSFVTLAGLLPPGVLGYVPKADVVDRTATVREALAFSARARLPSTVSNSAVSSIVEHTLSSLQLTGVADVVIGGSADAPPNISGGQLKRVNIGMELVAQPRVLLLDEPTAGLDASVALDLLSSLRTLATTRGITVVAVLHQPRAEAFTQFHSIVLLAKGEVAYAGRPEGAVPYFTSLEVPTPMPEQPGRTGRYVYGGTGQGNGNGAALSPKSASAAASSAAMNPADWIVDITAGLVQPVPMGQTRATRGHELTVDLGHLWREAQRLKGGDSVKTEDLMSPGPGAIARAEVSQAEEAELEASAPAQTASFGTQLWAQTKRGLVTRLRDHGSLALFTILHMFMAVALSSGFTIYLMGSYRTTIGPPLSPLMRAYCPSVIKELCERNTGDLGLQQLLFFMAFAVGSTCAQAAIGLFAMSGNGPALIRRECGDSGLSTLAFGLGRMAADLTIIAWNTSLFTGVWMLLGHAGHWWNWLGIIAATGFAASGTGYVASLLTRPVNAAVVVMIATVTQSVFSGVEPRLALVAPLPVLNWAWYLSYAPM